MRTRIVRTGTLAVMLATTGFALAACGPDDSNASDSSSASTSSSATASAPGGTAATGSNGRARTGGKGGAGRSGTSGGSSTTTLPGGSSPSDCTTDQLDTTAANFSSGAGTTGFQIAFQNTGTAPCTLTGYPGVSFVKIHNIQLGKAATHTAGAPTTKVTLIPNAHAYADVQTTNGTGGYSPSRCDLTTVPTLRVYPPNQTESTNIPWNKQECVGSSVQNLRVGPVHSSR
ncbi:DUF4232 domain-containing protein [Streptomyces sp. CA-111067]|uniref:DUF4232 domain-containing protein n=1 Tax=Streptomyces sp. CA-111067 TaxID=3240046 RepID=UPI003D955ED0